MIALPCMLYSMDLTVLNLAIPQLSAQLKPSGAQMLWIVDIYGFMVAGSLITMGTLGDRIGRRRLLMIGAFAFGVASVIAAFSTSAEMLIATRALLGVAGATLAPSTLSLIRNMFRDHGQRTFAIGVWATSYSIGGAIGPLLGGVLLQYFWWGSVFLLGVPVMVLLLIVGPRLLPEYRDPRPGPIDPISAALSLAAVLAVIYGLKRIAVGSASLPALGAIAIGLAIGYAFIHRQKGLKDPLIDLRLFAIPSFRVSLALYTIVTFTSFGIYIFLAQYLQLVLGLSPFMAGVWSVPSMLAFILGSLVSPALAKQMRPALAMSGGLLLSAIGFGLLMLLDVHSGPALMVAGSVIYSLGLCPVVILATDLIVGSAPVERAGAASAISETGAEFGGALGVALLGSVGTAVYRHLMMAVSPLGLTAAESEVARGTLGGALAISKQLPEGGMLIASARQAFVSGFHVVGALCVLLALIAAAAAITMLHRHGDPVQLADPA